MPGTWLPVPAAPGKGLQAVEALVAPQAPCAAFKAQAGMDGICVDCER
jgi:hypothetical protein